MTERPGGEHAEFRNVSVSLETVEVAVKAPFTNARPRSLMSQKLPG